MRKSVLAVMAAGSVFAITAAGATGLTLTGSSGPVNVDSHAADISVSTSVCTGAPALTYTDSGTGTLTAVKITGLTCTTPASGYKYVFSVALNNGTAETTDVTASVASGDTTTVALDPAFDIGSAALTQVDLDITVVATA